MVRPTCRAKWKKPSNGGAPSIKGRRVAYSLNNMDSEVKNFLEQENRRINSDIGPRRNLPPLTKEVETVDKRSVIV